MYIQYLFIIISIISIKYIYSCESGYYLNSNLTCTLCIPGSYCINNKINLCPSGYYGATYGLSTPTCTSICYNNSGYYCPPGSTSTTQYKCPKGFICNLSYPVICNQYKYCPEGSISELDCPLGTYSNKKGEVSSTCSGFCDIGHYGSTMSNSSKCTGPCEQGYLIKFYFK